MKFLRNLRGRLALPFAELGSLGFRVLVAKWWRRDWEPLCYLGGKGFLRFTAALFEIYHYIDVESPEVGFVVYMGIKA